MPAVSEKQLMRARLLRQRDGLSAAERERIDAVITQHTVALDAFKRAETVFTFLSFASEIDTRALIQAAWRSGKRVALPRCIPGTRQMHWYVVSSFSGLEKNTLGIEEPAANHACEVIPVRADNAVAIVPGLSFDDRGYRLGYGGGYYDLFLSNAPSTLGSVGLCRAAFLSQPESIPTERHDIPVQVVVTEHGVLDCA